MIWGQGDGSGLRAVDSKVGRVGQLACFEHNNPLARYALSGHLLALGRDLRRRAREGTLLS